MAKNWQKDAEFWKEEALKRDNQNGKLCEENSKLKEKLTSTEKKILELEEDFDSPLHIPIDLLFDVLPEDKAINTLSRLSTKLHGRITSRLEKLRNESGLLENRLEIFELNAKNISLGRNFKKI